MKRCLAQILFLGKSDKAFLNSNSVYFLNLKTQKEAFTNDNFKTQTQLKSFKKQIL